MKEADKEFQVELNKVKFLDLFRREFRDSLNPDCLDCTIMPKIFWVFCDDFLSNIEIFKEEKTLVLIYNVKDYIKWKWHVDVLSHMDLIIEEYYKREFFNQGWKERRESALAEAERELKILREKRNA